ncbi:MAG: hypothetical protein WDN26_19060 [Chitinophagaceae bacterium]
MQKTIPIYITLDKKRIPSSFEKNKSDQYLINYAIPLNSRFVTLGFETEKHIQYVKTIVLDTTYMDLQFFPESGELIHGLPSLLGVKLLRYDGRGMPAAGTITNNKDRCLLHLKQTELGMGSVWLNHADSNEKYIARILSPSRNNTTPNLSLAGGYCKRGHFICKQNGTENQVERPFQYIDMDSIIVRASCRGIIYYDLKGRLKNYAFEYSLPSNALPEGIINFTLMSHAGIPIAERLYFNERAESRIRISGITDKQAYTQREKTQISLEIKDGDGLPLPAHLSVMAFNRSQQGTIPDLRQDILSYFLLSSDLKGEIENPGFYFSKNENHFNDLDALLLTQGWSKYNYTRDDVAFQFKPGTLFYSIR